jgi:hypothetical protein
LLEQEGHFIKRDHIAAVCRSAAVGIDGYPVRLVDRGFVEPVDHFAIYRDLVGTHSAIDRGAVVIATSQALASYYSVVLARLFHFETARPKLKEETSGGVATEELVDRPAVVVENAGIEHSDYRG